MIAVDANGADQGPRAVAEGVARSGLPVLLFGPAAEIAGPAGPRADVVDAPETVKAGEEAVAAVRSKRDASIVQAAAAVGDGRAEALVSAGSTGPTLAAAALSIKRIKGVYRPALAVLMPIPGGPVLLLDAGASVEVRPEHLVQFAYMGAGFMEAVVGIERPTVGLLSVGEESGKGTPGVLTAHERIAEGGLNFVGNLEGFDLPHARARRHRGRRLHRQRGAEGARGLDEGDVERDPQARPLGRRLEPRRPADPRQAREAARRPRPRAVGGAILLGLRKPVVVGHGSFGPIGIEHAVRLAQRAVDEDMVGRTTSALEAAGALRSATAASVAER